MTAVLLVACSAAGADPAGAGSEGPARPAASAETRADGTRADGTRADGARGAVRHPAGWKQLPSIAGAVGAAARADGIVVDASDAWGEPAAGCYAVWLEVHGGAATPAALADQILDGIARLGAKASAAPPAAAPPSASSSASSSAPSFAISDVARPRPPDDVLAFAFARPPYRGRVRAYLGAGRISAVACFASQREPAACEATCTRVLRGAP